MTFWNIFWIVLGALGLIVICGFAAFFIYYIFKVGAESERKEAEYEETKYEIQSDL
jgi:hypothetical protein